LDEPLLLRFEELLRLRLDELPLLFRPEEERPDELRPEEERPDELRPDELRLPDEELERLDEPERDFDPLELLLDPLVPLRDRERDPCCDPLPPPLCCWSFSSSFPPSPSSFLPTATAAGTATPSAAPATTFFPVERPSLSSISDIEPPSLCFASSPGARR
jgi:hypothetical protein